MQEKTTKRVSIPIDLYKEVLLSEKQSSKAKMTEGELFVDTVKNLLDFKQEIQEKRSYVITDEMYSRLKPFIAVGLLSGSDDEVIQTIIEHFIQTKKEEGAELFSKL